MRDANKIPGLGRVGAGPREVLDMIKRFSMENSLSGRDVFIGTGMPNIPEQKKFIEEQIDFVKKQGGNPILMGVGPGTKKKPTTGQNEFLAGLAERKGLPYMGPLANSFPDITKDPMGLHLRGPQYQQLFKQYAKPQPTQQQKQVQPEPRAPRSADLLSQFTGAVMQAESRGKRYDKSGKLLTSKAGAMGEMQVMPGTVRDPGFGVRPAKDNSPDELARVGRDYAATMLRRYNNDPTAAAVAYNWGPGNADKWVKRGADFGALPKETQGYVTRITGQMGIPIAAKRAPAPKRADVPPVPPQKRAQAEDFDRESTLELSSRPAAPPQDQITRADMERMGPNYQAALAAMSLADSREDDDDYDDDETIAERYMERREMQMAQDDYTLEEEEPARVSPLAGLSEITYQSPFAQEEPVMMAEGGEAKSMMRRLYEGAVPAELMPGYAGYANGGEVGRPPVEQPSSARRALNALLQAGRAGASNVESLARGSVAGFPGMVGDVESIFRDDKVRRFPTSEEIEKKYLPKRISEPTKEASIYTDIGGFIDPFIALKAPKLVAGAAKKAFDKLGPTAAAQLERLAPAAQPMYAVKPKGGVFYPAESGSNIDRYLSKVIKSTLKDSPNITGKENIQKASDIIREKGRRYLTSVYATENDPIREAVLEGRAILTGDGAEKLTPELLRKARSGSPEELKIFTTVYDNLANIKGNVIDLQKMSSSQNIERRAAAEAAEIAKMQREGVPPELINSEIYRLSQADLADPTVSPASAMELEDLIRGQSSDMFNPDYLTGAQKAILTAANKGEPIYDLRRLGPELDILQSETAGKGIASLTMKDIEQMSYPEMVIRGAKNTLLERSGDAVIQAVEKGKDIPKKFYSEGVTPIKGIENTGWVTVDTPFAVKLEGVAMKHSVDGYADIGGYGHGGRKAFLSGKAKVFSLRPEGGKPSLTVEARVDPEGLYISQIKGPYNSLPTPEEKRKVFELFNRLRPYDFKSKNNPEEYPRNRSGELLRTKDTPKVDWAEEYQNYLRYQNKGAE
jgi:hypothetical protein